MAKGGEFLLPSDQLPQVFTADDLTNEQRMIRDTVKEVVAKTITTDDAVRIIESKNFHYSRMLLHDLAEVGFLGIEVPEEYGGTNLGVVVSAIVAEEIAKQGSFACTFLAHTGIGTLPIKFFGTEEQKKKYLPKLVSGEWVVSYCLTEGRAGSDANSVKTTAERSWDGWHYVLNGEKIFVTNGGFADLFIVFAQLKDVGLTAFILEKDWLKVGREEHKMGIQGSSTATVVLDNARVPERNILGEPGKGFKIAVNILNLGRFKLGAACLGAGKACLLEALAYAKQRKQFGKAISNFGAIRQKLALMAAKNYAMESVVYRTAGMLEEAIHNVDAGDSKAILKAIEEFAVECSLVKVFCSEALDYIVDENVQIHGGSGFCEGGPERHYRDSRINRIFEGTNEINRLLAVGMIFKKALPKKDKEGNLQRPELPLMDAIKKVVAETMSPSLQMEPEDTTERLTNYLNNAKKAVLLVAGSAYEKFGLKLEEHQMVLMALSDCLINLYVMESSLAASSKTGNPEMVRLIFHDSLFEVERLSRELAVMCSEGDNQKMQLAMIRRLLKFTPENQEELCNKVSECLLQN